MKCKMQVVVLHLKGLKNVFEAKSSRQTNSDQLQMEEGERKKMTYELLVSLDI